MNLSGQWSGEFAYPQGAGPTTPFLASLADHNGKLSGSIIEIDLIAGQVIQSDIFGVKQGFSVDFTKTYLAGAPEQYSTPVDYVGHISEAGTVIKGVWSLLDWDGTFEMRREATSSEEFSIQEVVEVVSSNP